MLGVGHTANTGGSVGNLYTCAFWRKLGSGGISSTAHGNVVGVMGNSVTRTRARTGFHLNKQLRAQRFASAASLARSIPLSLARCWHDSNGGRSGQIFLNLGCLHCPHQVSHNKFCDNI